MMHDNTIEKLILNTVDLPSLPPVASKVLQLVNKDGSSIAEMEDLIAKDQAFSTRILRVANSPYYGRGRSIDTVSSAIMMIGFNTMKSLVVAASLKDMHSRFGLFEKKLWEHSLAVSITASLIARKTRLVPDEEAMVAALLHDVGKTVLNNSMSGQYSLVIERVFEEGIPFYNAETDMLGFNHCNVGGLIARKWKLPKGLEAVIEYHHADDLPAFEDTSYEVMCGIVKVADALCLNLGIGFQMQRIIPDIDIQALGLTNEDMDSISVEVEESVQQQLAELLAL
ncbi:MAG: HDOD domain-containing protein [Dissulfurispiraceae bacterium]|jgi:putative nucleotidyltransferase with HDIG domain|nr:HDOD domain-containing protein [Dissulfurispiraceae bacterium]